MAAYDGSSVDRSSLIGDAILYTLNPGSISETVSEDGHLSIDKGQNIATLPMNHACTKMIDASVLLYV